jgi:hypothetical protein
LRCAQRSAPIGCGATLALAAQSSMLSRHFYGADHERAYDP